MRIVAIAIIIAINALLASCQRPAQQPSSAFNIQLPSPTPTARCWIYEAIYPATDKALTREHATMAELREIKKWAAPLSPAQLHSVRMASPWASPPLPSELHLVRWMRDPHDKSVYIFVARPINRPHTLIVDGYSPWIALNANLIIDPVECELHAYPGA